MGFPGDEDGEALWAGWREMDFCLHAEIVAGFFHVLQDFDAIKTGGGPGGLKSHAELAAGDLFLHCFDVRAELEEKLGDASDYTGLVVADEGDGSEMLSHGWSIEWSGANGNTLNIGVKALRSGISIDF